ncbi:MAG: thiamine phosphate synthase, partial [Methylococcales bacterium]|nr:thiamine phosphate synthase [Methylococcales bacterium]
LDFLSIQSSNIPVIIDPVLAASSGDALLSDQGIRLLLNDLLPLAALITPNVEELALLTGLPVTDYESIERAALQLLESGARAVLVKGGHFHNEKQSIDFFVSEQNHFWLVGERWPDRNNVRGTGCVFATAVAASMSKGCCLSDALVFAKALISQGIRNAIKVGEHYQFQLAETTLGEHFQLKDWPKLIHEPAQITQSFEFAQCSSKRLGIYPVVDSFEWIKKLVPLGIETIQLRIKNLPAERIEQIIIEAIDFCRDKARLFINDYWQLAIKHGAYGIHLGQEDLDRLDSTDLLAIAESGCCLGISTHSYTEMARAHALKPSYLALGPVFSTTSKEMPWIPQGVKAVEQWVALLGDHYPLVAIGGINLHRASTLKQTGVGSVAMISTITQAKDYRQATNELLLLWMSS